MSGGRLFSRRMVSRTGFFINGIFFFFLFFMGVGLFFTEEAMFSFFTGVGREKFSISYFTGVRFLLHMKFYLLLNGRNFYSLFYGSRREKIFFPLFQQSVFFLTATLFFPSSKESDIFFLNGLIFFSFFYLRQ